MVDYKSQNYISQELILAQELQKSREYKRSRELYMHFFIEHPKHYLRFKALFEVADNLYYEKKYDEAVKSYNKFLNYCDEQYKLTSQEISWVNAYKNLSYSRIKAISKKNY
ncbi:tetratricopeptide repeat protein [Clostridium felsineum]|uniref:tetratricopeptide repeat protein n=1 Tax=Clostridium felsineum TaxID=36839 RepID=UPI00098CD13B|nr:hypothetical protein [Clostridium felsineum]URZ14072.1 hypothetical protein CLFE_000470 [Clostridium felsineum DSM 794]